MSDLPDFALLDQRSEERAFPTGRPTLLAFVKEDCPTCGTSMPLIEGAHRAFGGAVEVLAIGQEAEGNAILVDRHDLTLPLLDDSELDVSYRYDLETVPTVILTDADGAEVDRFIGFGREDWRALYGRLADLAETDAGEVDWERYPVSQPGCGSRTLEPGIAERLAAEAEGSPLRARRIEVGSADDVEEFMFDQGFTDGLPVVAPSPERVLRMLGGTRRDAQDVVAIVPPNMGEATVEKIAINAVLAGCKPEYLPVVIAAVEAVCTEQFNAHGVMATTMGASPRGDRQRADPRPHRDELGPRRARAGQPRRTPRSGGPSVSCCVTSAGRSRAGTERSMLGSPAKFTLAFAEREEHSPWEPFHVTHGYEAAESVVSVFPASPGPLVCVDQTSRTAEALAGSLAMSVQAIGHPRSRSGEILMVLCPEHVDTIGRDGWTRADLQRRLWELTHRPVRELLIDDRAGAGIPPESFGPDGPSEEQLDELIPKFQSPDNIHIVIAGSGAGKFTSIFPGWASGLDSRKIEEVA